MNTLTFKKLKLPSHPDKEFWPITLCPALFGTKAYRVIPTCTPSPSKTSLSKRLPFPILMLQILPIQVAVCS